MNGVYLIGNNFVCLQPCTNPDCLYLHEIGSQEDSFTKDEIISAYTRYICFLVDYVSDLNLLCHEWEIRFPLA